jgi:Fe-S cluster assembly protein SufD
MNKFINLTTKKKFKHIVKKQKIIFYNNICIHFTLNKNIFFKKIKDNEFVLKITKETKNIHIIYINKKKIKNNLKITKQLEKNSNINIITISTSYPNTKAITNKELKININKNSKLNLVNIVNNNSIKHHYINKTINQNFNSEITLKKIIYNLNYYQENIELNLLGTKIKNKINYLKLSKKNQKKKLNSKIKNKQPNNENTCNINSITKNNSNNYIKGTIKVFKTGDKIESHLGISGLMLTPTSSTFTEPNLEIYNKNIVCTHNSTIKNINKKYLEYPNEKIYKKKYSKKTINTVQY